MAFTIHGDYLRPGFCEVHPWVEEVYPCTICTMKERQERYARASMSPFTDEGMNSPLVREMKNVIVKIVANRYQTNEEINAQLHFIHKEISRYG